MAEVTHKHNRTGRQAQANMERNEQDEVQTWTTTSSSSSSLMLLAVCCFWRIHGNLVDAQACT